jgi:Chaperone for flagella basal body P-ring formation
MMLALSRGLALGLLLVSAHVCAVEPRAPHATVDLAPAVQIPPGQPLTLGRVARIASNDLSLLRQLMATSIGPALSPGAVITLRQERLADVLPANVRWSGAQATQVTVKVQSVKAADVVQAARAALAQWLRTRAVGSYTELVATPPDIHVPPGEVTLRVRPLGQGPVPTRRMTVWTEIWADGAFHIALPTTFEVQLADPPGTSFWVRRGESAVLTHSIGNVTVQTKAQALQDGAAGRTIQIKTGSTHAVLHAQVIGQGQLELAK